MARLRFLWVIHTTANQSAADTNELFRLVLRDPLTPGETVILPFPGLPHNERELGRTDEYVFDMQEADRRVDMDALRPEHIGMTIRGGDAWLPRSVWVIGQDDDNRRRLLVAQPDWPPQGWFSTQTSDANGQAQPTRFLDL